MKSVTVEYKTKKSYCDCCGQEVANPRVSDLREYVISEELVRGWGDFKFIIEHEDDLNDMVEEFVYETISFFTVGSGAQIVIENDQLDKVKGFVRDLLK